MRNGKIRSVNFNDQNGYAELYGIDGQPLEFEWNFFHRIHID